jgi:cobalt/nickel transport system permease protein
MPLSLLAVHLSDGVLATGWVVAGFVGAAALLLPALCRVRDDEISRIGVLTAAFFVSSSPHLPLPVLPTSVHLILNGLVGVILGRRAPLAIAVGLLLQRLLLSHGGLSTLGINACIVGVPAVLAGWSYPILRAMRIPSFARGALVGGGAVALTVTLNFLVLLFGGKDDWGTLARLVLLAHLPIVVVEAILLGVIVSYLEKVKPEMLRRERLS